MYRQRNSRALKKARQRALNIGSLDPNLDLGHGLTLPAYLEAIELTQQTFEAYNTALQQLIRFYDAANDAEAHLTDLNERMLSGILTKFGRNSTEYRMAGGRLKGRRRSSKATAEPTLEETIAAPSESTKATTRKTTSSIAPSPGANGTRNGASLSA